MKNNFNNNLFKLIIIITSLVFSNLTWAQYTLTDDDVIIDDNGIIQICKYDFSIKDIIIPQALQGKTVKGIASKSTSADGVFHQKEIKSVTFPSTIESIGDHAFGWNEIANSNLGECENLTYIGTWAFGLNKLSTIDLTKCLNLEIIGDYAFYRNSLTTLNLENCKKLKTIGDFAFYENSISSLDISKCTKLEYIGEESFRDNSMTSLTLNGCSELKTIGNLAFYENSFTSLDLSNCTKLESIGYYTFCNLKLSSVNFSGCSNLKTIGKDSFSNNSLTSLNLSSCDSLMIIGENAFRYNEINDLNLNNCKKLKEIGSYAFCGISLENLDLSSCDNLEIIKDNAFEYCGITTINLSNCQSLLTIEGSAFRDNLIESLNLSDCKKLKTIGSFSFYGNKISSLNLSGCIELEKIDNDAFRNNLITNLDLSSCTKLTTISSWAFQENLISSLDLSNCPNLAFIGNGAFINNHIENLKLIGSKSLTYIGMKAFSTNYLVNFMLPTPEKVGHKFLYWKDSETGQHEGGGTVSNLALTYEAKFEIKEPCNISASANPSNGGSISGTGSFDYGTTTNLIATAATGYNFVNWTENGTEVSTDPEYSFTVTSDRTLVANFKVQSFNISANANPSNGGSISGTGNFNYGTTTNLIATAATGYNFVNWTENGTEVSTDPEYSFTVTSDRTLVANFDNTVGIFDKIEVKKINIYPNPSTGIFTIEGLPIYENILITIYSTNGKIVNQAYSSSSDIQFDINSEPNGRYIIVINSKTERFSMKITKI